MDINTCRICCADKGTTNIFNADEAINLSKKLTHICVNISVAENDGLPQYICPSCIIALNSSYKFVVQCEISDKKIRSAIEYQSSLIKSANLNIKEETPVDANTEDDFADYDNFNDAVFNVLGTIKQDIKPDIKNITEIKDYVKRRKCGQSEVVCNVCGRSCRSRSAYQTHLRSHSDEKPFHCVSCNKSYKDEASLRKHDNKTHLKAEKRRNFICETCGKGFYSRSDIRIHMRVHTGETPYACPICPKKFSQHSSLIRHERRHSNIRPFLCSQCSKSFICKEDLKLHLISHSTEKNYQCPLCSGWFKYKETLRRHIKLHSDKKSFVCNYCGKTFGTKGNMKLHIENIHSMKSGQCNICSKTVSNLEVHMRKHTGERPLKCDLCPSTFYELNGLSHHINFKHKNTNRFKCSYEGCNDMFPNQPMLNFHEAKLHGTVIPFPCPQCSRGFYRKNDLARHMIGTHKEKLK